MSTPARSAQIVELFGRGGAERVGRDQQHPLAPLRVQRGRELADRRRLPAAVDADDQGSRPACVRAPSPCRAA